MRHQGRGCRKKGGTKTEPWDKTQRGQGDKEALVKETEERPERGEKWEDVVSWKPCEERDSGTPSELKNDQFLRTES